MYSIKWKQSREFMCNNIKSYTSERTSTVQNLNSKFKSYTSFPIYWFLKKSIVMIKIIKTSLYITCACNCSVINRHLKNSNLKYKTNNDIFKQN